jgi:hypothetical protein
LEKVKDSFYVYFPNAKKVNWQEFPDATKVSFIDGDIQERIIFSKDESDIQFFRYYKGEHLLLPIQLILKKKFPGLTVYGVTEITTVSQINNELILKYGLILEDATKWYSIQMDSNGTITELKKYKK